MGNKQETPKRERRDFLNMFEMNYRAYSSIVHKTFGCIDIYEDKSTGAKDIFLKALYIQGMDIEGVVKKLENRIITHHINILAVYEITKDMRGPCSIADALTLYCQYIDTDLKREINYRRKTKRYFAEGQLWKILYGLLSALNHLHQAQEFHGQISVSDVLIHKKFNIVKLVDKALTIGENLSLHETSENKVRILKNKNILFAPSIMRCLQNKKTQMNAYDPFKADVYSTGMVLIEAGTLQDVCYLYDYNSFTIKSEDIKKRLKQMLSRYSPQFVKLISEILEEFDDPRPSAKELLSRFPEDKIKNVLKTSLQEPLLYENFK